MNTQEELLRKTLELCEENNKILQSLRRSNRIKSFFKAVGWILVIVLSIMSYYFIKPYMNILTDTYFSAMNQADEIKSIGDKVLEKVNGI